MEIGGDSSGFGGKRQWSLRPQDLVIALKLAVLPAGEEKIPYAELAEQLYLSTAETHGAITRLIAARLAVDRGEGVAKPIKAILAGLLIYGAPYVFPPIRGGITIGFPTAYAVPPLREKVLFADETPPVWPHPEGPVRGLALYPLYPKLPLAARNDQRLYALLALFDAMRIGQARERQVAAQMINQQLQ
jgi:hypothetical protein